MAVACMLAHRLILCSVMNYSVLVNQNANLRKLILLDAVRDGTINLGEYT
jgi:hypothetical protein